jgi:hypothetical protein
MSELSDLRLGADVVDNPHATVVCAFAFVRHPASDWVISCGGRNTSC